MNALQLAWSNLWHHRARTLLAVVGVGAVVLLVFMQLGFLDSVRRTATLLSDKLDFDLLIISKGYISLGLPGSFSRDRLGQAGEIPGVRSVQSLTVSYGLWRRSRDRSETGEVRPEWSIMVLAVEPSQLEHVFRDPQGTVFGSSADLRRCEDLLGRTNTVLIDRTSRPEYGNLDTWRSGASYDLNSQEVVIGGDIAIGTGFGYNALVLVSEETLASIGGWPRGQVTFGLLAVEPGSDLAAIKQRLTAQLPPDVEVLTRADLENRERFFWMSRSAVGQFFLVGVGVALVVGGIFVYQMMAADINKHLPEYATIRALGYKGGYLSRVVYSQGGLLALVGYIPGVLLSLGCYALIRSGAGIPLVMTGERLGSVLLMTLAMCLISAAMAVRIVQRANPADLF